MAVAAARLGARTAFLGKIGRDGFGDYLKSVLEENQVDVAGLRTDEAATTLAVVTVSPSGERSFRFMRGADCNLSPDEVDVRQLEGAQGAPLRLGQPHRRAVPFGHHLCRPPRPSEGRAGEL